MLAALLTSLVVRLAAAALVTAGATASLALLARRHGRGEWPALSALVLGRDDEEESAPGQDLRFAAVVASVASSLAWVVALDSRFREMPGASRALVLALGIPIAALIVTATADLLARERSRAPIDPEDDPVIDMNDTAVAAATVAVAPTAAAPPLDTRPPLESSKLARPPSVTREQVRPLIEAALAEVGAARARTEDQDARHALASLEVTLAEYGRLVDDDDADLDRIALRVREATALAKACDDDGAEAFRTLGLKRDASPDQAKRIYRELARLYHQDAAAPGVDPERFKDITAAYEKVRATLIATAPAEPV